MNCRLFSQHENYTTESQIVKLIYDIMILTARSMLLKSNCPKRSPCRNMNSLLSQYPYPPDILSIFTYNIYTKFYGLFSGYFQPSMPFRH